jgi:hypothetical protein
MMVGIFFLPSCDIMVLSFSFVQTLFIAFTFLRLSLKYYVSQTCLKEEGVSN